MARSVPFTASGVLLPGTSCHLMSSIMYKHFCAVLQAQINQPCSRTLNLCIVLPPDVRGRNLYAIPVYNGIEVPLRQASFAVDEGRAVKEDSAFGSWRGSACMGWDSRSLLIMNAATKPVACEKAITPSKGPASCSYSSKSLSASSVFWALCSSIQDRKGSDGEARVCVPNSDLYVKLRVQEME
jgi:hypothetical protein